MFRVLRIFKAFRYSKSMILVGEVIKNSSEALIAVASLAIGYIFVIALIMFNIEPENFRFISRSHLLGNHIFNKL